MQLATSHQLLDNAWHSDEQNSSEELTTNETGREMGRRDDDRERRSWRDIDRKKDSSHHIDQSDPYQKKRGGARSQGRSTSYKSALDSFFDGGALPERYQKLTKTRDELKKTSGKNVRQKALRNLCDAMGSAEIVSAVKEILKIDGELPRDVDALLSVLQHPDEGTVQDAIKILDEIVFDRPLKRRDLLIQRLRRVEDLAEEPETAKCAGELRRKL